MKSCKQEFQCAKHFQRWQQKRQINVRNATHPILAVATLERPKFGIFIVNFEHIHQIHLVFLLLIFKHSQLGFKKTNGTFSERNASKRKFERRVCSDFVNLIFTLI